MLQHRGWLVGSVLFLAVTIGTRAAFGQLLNPKQLDPMPGQTYTQATGVNGAKQVVGTSGPFAVRWDTASQTSPSPLSNPIGYSVDWNEAFAINRDGQSVGAIHGSFSEGRTIVAVRWDANGQPIVLDWLAAIPGYSSTSTALAINVLGHAAGHVSNGIGQSAARWDGTALLVLAPYNGAPTSRAYGINDSDYVVGVSGGQETPVIWDPAGVVTKLPCSPWGAAYAINNAGQVAGYCGSVAVRWDRSPSNPTDLTLMTMTELHQLPGISWSRAYAINEVGQIVGETGAGYGQYAVRWDGMEPTVLDSLTGASAARANAINNDGYVAGYNAISGNPDSSLLAVLWAPNVCGDGVRKGNEACDDGNTGDGDGCEHDCTITPEKVTDVPVAPGGVATTLGTNTDATPTDPVETRITSPEAGTVTIDEKTPSVGSTGYEFVPSGYGPIGQQVNIDAPLATPQSPLKIEFFVDLSQIPGGDYNAIQVSRDGVLVPPCTSSEPPLLDTDGDGTLDAHDPCFERQLVPSSDQANDPDDVKFTVFTSHASAWLMVVPLTTCDIDADADGTPNCRDACPSDATKTSPGLCGCGIPDTWSGFLQPINADGTSVFKVGSTVPVKFALTEGCGDTIGGSLLAKLYLAKLTNLVAGNEMEAISTSTADSGNVFRYDPKSAQYIFNLGTKSLSSGTWQLRVDVGDGVARTVQISLRK